MGRCEKHALGIATPLNNYKWVYDIETKRFYGYYPKEIKDTAILKKYLKREREYIEIKENPIKLGDVIDLMNELMECAACNYK
jgi:hypothetical protein